MTDLSRLFADLCAGLDSDTVSSFPGLHPEFPGDFETTGKEQSTDISDVSRISRISRSENIATVFDDIAASEFANFPDQRVARTSSYVKTPGNPGNPGNEVKGPILSTASLFPIKDKEPGKPGNGDGLCERPIPDLNRAGPQRGDWWDEGTLAALAPQLAPAPAGAPLQISAAEVQAGVERELRALAGMGRTGEMALQDAVDITRAKVRNAPALAGRQLNTGRCHVCEAPLDDSLPVVAVLTGRRGATLLLHAGCHGEHTRRVADLVERIMAAAGFGADRQEAREAGR